MQVEIPDVIYAFITESLGKDASDVLVDAFLSTLDKGNRLKLYVKLSEEYERKAIDGETCWKALSYVFKAIAEIEGMEISSYQDYYSLADYLSFKLNNTEIIKYFLNAEKLHAEYHPRPQDKDSLKVRMDHCKKLIEVAKEYLRKSKSLPEEI
jgi:superfamily I DNA/RNA helicase